jgi:elongation factor Tu
MTIQDVFTIRGRGTVVTGQIEAGTVTVGDELSFRRDDGLFKRAVVTGLEAFRKQLEQAGAGDSVGILFADVNKPELQRGDVLTGSAAEFTWKP